MNASFIKEYQLEDPSICDAFLELFEKAKEVNSEQVQAAIKKYFDPNKRTILVGVQK